MRRDTRNIGEREDHRIDPSPRFCVKHPQFNGQSSEGLMDGQAGRTVLLNDKEAGCLFNAED